MQKSLSKYLIKPVENGYFFSYFRKMDPKSIKKALGFSLKVDAVSPLREMLKSIGPRAFWSIGKG